MDLDKDKAGVDRLFVCKEHVELALDIIVDELEKAPELRTLEQAGLDETEAGVSCCRCDQPAEYVVE